MKGIINHDDAVKLIMQLYDLAEEEGAESPTLALTGNEFVIADLDDPEKVWNVKLEAFQ